MPAAPPIRVPRRLKPRVLVVEDSPEVRRFIVESLADGYEVVAASDGREALSGVQGEPPALVLTDLRMPNLDGPGLVAELRRRREFDDVPIVIIAGAADEEVKARLLAKDAQDFLPKPFSRLDLQIRVRNLIAMRRTRESHRTLFNHMAQGYCVIEVLFDPQGKASDYRILESNRAFAQHTGLEQPNGRLASDLVPGLEQGWYDFYGRVVLSGEPASRESESRAQGRWYEVHAYPTGAPAAAQLAVFFSDVTARKRAEMGLRESEAEARAANLAKDDFLAALSHELRTPLNPVLLLASEGAADPDLTEDVRRDFQIIAENAAIEARLIDDLFDLNRIVRGKVELERESLDLHALIEGALGALRGQLADKRLRLRFDLLAGSRVVSADPIRLRQVFWNVLKNAVKFTPVNGSIEIATSNPAEGSAVELRVRDSGVGIPADDLTRIFQPFVQGRRGAAEGGLGLGLAISQKLVALHGGRIEAQSAGENQGTTLMITLPLADPAPPNGR
ncbi:MAG TPA: ATP-binding protein [Opitutaceae bacterium]|nr:ATP-binding protein [Opitutaceae bacterium]